MHSKQQGLRSTACIALSWKLGSMWANRGGAVLSAMLVDNGSSVRRLKEVWTCRERLLSNGRDGVRDHHRRELVALLCAHTKERGLVQAAAWGTVNAIEATRTTKHRVQCPRGSSAQYGETGEVLCLVQAAARRTPVYTSREQRLQGAACNTHTVEAWLDEAVGVGICWLC